MAQRSHSLLPCVSSVWVLALSLTGKEGDRTTWKEMEEQIITYIGTFGARETHDTRLSTGPLRTWRSRTTIFTRGSLKEGMPFSEHRPFDPIYPSISTTRLLWGRRRMRHQPHTGLTKAATSRPRHTHGLICNKGLLSSEVCP